MKRIAVRCEWISQKLDFDVWDARFCPQGDILAAAGDGAKVCFFNTNETLETSQNETTALEIKGTEKVSQLEWSPDGRFLLCCS
ncbi:hypothetical protein MHBO_003959, partial [Bonamia ostreae]